MKRAAEQQLKGILDYHRRAERLDRLQPRSALVDFALDQTKVMDGKLSASWRWYDNEWGFSNRMADTAVAMGKLI